MSQYRHGQIKIDFDNHGRRNQVKMKEINLLRDRFFNYPTTGIFADYLLNMQISIVGNDNSRFYFTVTGNGDLAISLS